MTLRLVGTWLQHWSGVSQAALMMRGLYVPTHMRMHVRVCPDYAGIIVGRWRKLSLKVRVVWLISSSLYHFN